MRWLLLVSIFMMTLIWIESLLIYRRKPKPKLICYEEQGWTSPGSKYSSSTGVSIIESLELNRRKRSVGEQAPEPVIYLYVSGVLGVAYKGAIQKDKNVLFI